MRLPSEEILQYIEKNRNIEISRHGFASQEYYNPYHAQGKHIPVFYANNGIGDGSHTPLVEINKVNYVVGTTGKAHAKPVAILRSGRSSE